ncbi:MAG TPA: caspase family protein [Alphaproteobacteria bacterium]|nr:caspase family protein [Alphaproteobacteria bacterium]
MPPRVLRPLVALALLTGLWGAARAESVPTAPVLRVETGMHGAAINRIAVRAAEGQVLTVADDKTLRIWSLADGGLLRTVRGPVGDGPEGALYAAAVSKSGKTLIAGGHTGLQWDNTGQLYFFDREGNWVGRFAFGAVRSDAITALAFSPDGKWLYVGANDGRGLRRMDVAQNKGEVADGDYAGEIRSLDVAPDGRVATAAADGRVRLYDPGLKRIATAKVPAGTPYHVAFDPTGARLAVGLLDADRALVLSGYDLKPQGDFKGEAGRRGALSVVAWSSDGSQLWGAGTYGEADGRKLVRRWPADGKGKGRDVGVADDTITDLEPTDDGGMAYASAEPAWGVLAADGAERLRRGRETADFRDGAAGGFLLSADGGTVDFGFRQGGRGRARFDLVARTLTLDPAARGDLRAPQEKAGGLAFADWRNGTKPKLNGKPLALEANERSRSVAADAAGGVLGGDFFLRSFDAKGAPGWRTAVPAPAWTVNLSDRFVVAGLGDGTLRWYGRADGAEALSLYPHPDGQRWIAWTPEGFFDHGPGGERLIGYHLNRIEDGRLRGAELVTVEQLYGLFQRGDLVTKRYAGGHEGEIADALARIGAIDKVLGRGLPPRVRLIEYCLPDGSAENCTQVGPELLGRGGGKRPVVGVPSQELVLRFEVEDRGGGVGPIVLRRKNATVKAEGKTRAVNGRTRIEERVVPLESGLNRLQISAYNAAQEIEIDPEEQPSLLVRSEFKAVERPVLHLLAIGVDRYAAHGIAELKNAEADAKGIVAALSSEANRKVFSKVEPTLLTGTGASAAAIRDAFGAIARKARPEDAVVVFLAGHGVALDGRYYFLPQDLPDQKKETILAGGIGHAFLTEQFQSLKSAQTLVLLDSCFSGAFAVEDALLRQSRDQTFGRQMSHASGRYILSASSSQQEALDGEDGHGVFTGVVLKALAGQADRDRRARGNENGEVDTLELMEYAKAEVPEASRRISKGTYKQVPQSFTVGQDHFVVRTVQ